MSIKATQPEDSEREAFEAWRRGETKMKNKDDAVARLGFGQDAVYENRHTKAMWYAWQKRAALATPSPQPATTKEVGSEAWTRPRLQLERWGRSEKETGLLLTRMEDGYWTPWHIAQVAVDLAAAAQPAEAKTAAVDEMTAWRDYAQHLEWCATCAEDSVGSCHEGTALKEAAAIATQEGGHD